MSFFVSLGLTFLISAWLFCGLAGVAGMATVTTRRGFFRSWRTMLLCFVLGPASWPGVLEYRYLTRTLAAAVGKTKREDPTTYTH